MSSVVSDPETYFRALIPDRSDLLRRLEAEADREAIPIVGPVVGLLLYILARSIGARRILELGTATGYSAIFLAEACRESGGKVITLEADPAMAARARRNAEAAGTGKWDRGAGVGMHWTQFRGLDTGFRPDLHGHREKGLRPGPARLREAAFGRGAAGGGQCRVQGCGSFNRAVIKSSAWRARQPLFVSARALARTRRHLPRSAGMIQAVSAAYPNRASTSRLR